MNGYGDMRGLRVLFVENDPALLGLLSESLRIQPGIEQVTPALSAKDVSIKDAIRYDVALLDVGLGSESLSGIELGFQLRARNPNIGIVLFSQLITSAIQASLPGDTGHGWSTVSKSADLSMDYLVKVLVATAKGLNVMEPKATSLGDAAEAPNRISKLSSKQQQIMSLVASGLDAVEIAHRLGYAAVTIRQELSKAYKVLVPNPTTGTDLRTTAVLNYLRESRGATYHD